MFGSQRLVVVGNRKTSRDSHLTTTYAGGNSPTDLLKTEFDRGWSLRRSRVTGVFLSDILTRAA